MHELENSFNLTVNEDSQFFSEWQTALPEINSYEMELLDKVRASYTHLTKYPSMLENAVQIIVLSPLLHLSNLLLPPFLLKTETSVSISTEDDETRIEGRIDVLMLKDKFWALVIESKRAELSIKVGFAQILAYMLANPNSAPSCYGMITTGGSFIFIKLIKNSDDNNTPKYGTSRIFELRNPGNELYTVVRILKLLGQTVLDSASSQDSTS